MGERVLLCVLSGLVGVLIGLFGPLVFTPASEVRQAEQAFLDPPTRSSSPQPTIVLVLPRPVVGQTAVPPTLAPASAPAPEPTPAPPRRTFVIALEGGGEMTVNASDYQAAINNVKSTGAVPAEPEE